MPTAIRFNDVNRTNNVSRDSIRIESNLTSEVDTCFLTILYYGGKTFKPTVGDTVEIYSGAVFGIATFGSSTFAEIIFGGIVVRITERMIGARLIAYDVECADYTRLMDKKLVAEAYSSTPISSIITDIVATYLSGFTTVNVVCPITVDYVAFNYEQPSKCFQRLAELVGYDWYVDYDKDIHFFSKETNLSPFNLTDSNGKYLTNSLKIIRDISQIKNVIYVRGGEYLADLFTEEQIGDGSKTDFKLAYKYNTLTVQVNSTPITVGVDYLDVAADFDCLYNFNEKLIKFRSDNKPNSGTPVSISGYPYVPVIVEARNQDSINSNGEFQFRIIDKSIKTKAGARTRGSGEISAYANQISEGSFRTYESGLRSGQLINIQSDIRDLDENFLINRVSAIMRTESAMEYEVSIVSTKTMGIMEFLQKLLMSDDRKLTINEDEVVDKLWTGLDNLAVFQEESYVFDDPVLGPWYVSGGVGTPVGVVGFCSVS